MHVPFAKLIERCIPKVHFTIWKIVYLETGLDLLGKTLHVGTRVYALCSSSLEPEAQAAITEVSLEGHKVHDLLALVIVEHSLGLTTDLVWQVEVAHNHTSCIRVEPENSRLHIILPLIRVA